MSHPRLGNKEYEMENPALLASQLSLLLCVDCRHNAHPRNHSHEAGSKMLRANLVVVGLRCCTEWLYLQ
jgi:hypothetical protein